MIRDTSAQDRSLDPAQAPRPRGPLWLAGAAVLAVVVLGWVLSGWVGSARSVSAERLRLAEASRGLLVRDASANGRVVAAVSPTLYAPAGGTVTLRILAGDTVEAGQVLAEIDSPELHNELQREQATLAQLEAEVARQRILARKASLLAQREADDAEVTRLAATRDLQRAQRGYELGAIPEVEYLRAKDAMASADIRSKHAGSAAALEAQDVALALKTQEQLLERQRLLTANLERRVDELNVRAPVAGIIGTLSIADRAVVAANSPLMTVVDLSRLEVELEMPESYAEDLGLGMAAEVRIGANSQAGKISAISPEVVNNQVLVRVRFEGGQPAGLRQNQRVTARVLFEEKPDVVKVARGPFVEQLGGRFAYVVEDGIAVRRPIRLGATSVGEVEILEGVAPGERLVISGTDTFGDAERVAIND
ncbi:efflux RND transporter periplasmic adaptor subunit [Arenimonas caeni]|jgi:HlyD family secretion protein|uniref:Efflux transporter periplasmic adaptor subunit n=1 Tax=Arenimonas caeni TaxID=2058085 RepID=A0A2P6M6R7_9GAMM|nr:efflux RND transporter periplasmic adaptor subunit [Arenimonas caeni]MDY0021990.1 efflux RND transporter periplasmic adaptor subunit [Arenimonas caeni]PRH81694.1 efflux transporter periplasmic adaptor subunit [Arenimonas caeni]